MKVSELIEKLRILPQDAKVIVVEPEYWDGDEQARAPFDDADTGLRVDDKVVRL